MDNVLPTMESQGVSVDALSKQLDWGYDFISKNVKDLSTTVLQFDSLKELTELHDLAYTNLKNQLEPSKPLAQDPTLVLEAYKMISGVIFQTMESKRKAAETLMKARSLVDVPHALVNKQGNDLFEDSGNAFNEDVSKASLSSSTDHGIYGKLVVSADDSDPEM